MYLCLKYINTYTYTAYTTYIYISINATMETGNSFFIF